MQSREIDLEVWEAEVRAREESAAERDWTADQHRKSAAHEREGAALERRWAELSSSTKGAAAMSPRGMSALRAPAVTIETLQCSRARSISRCGKRRCAPERRAPRSATGPPI